MDEEFESAGVGRLIAAEAAIPSGDSTGDATRDGEPFGGGYGSPPVTVAELEAAARRAAARRAATHSPQPRRSSGVGGRPKGQA